MMTIKIDKGGFGIANLFSTQSTKEELLEQSNLQGNYLDELGIKYQIGDTITLKTPLRSYPNAWRVHKIKIYEIDEKNEKYLAEFV